MTSSLTEHPASCCDDLPVLGVGVLLLVGGGRRVRRRDGRVEVVEHLLICSSLSPRRPSATSSSIFCSAVGESRWNTMASMVETARRAASSIARLDLLLLVPLLGRVEVLGHGERDDVADEHERRRRSGNGDRRASAGLLEAGGSRRAATR